MANEWKYETLPAKVGSVRVHQWKKRLGTTILEPVHLFVKTSYRITDKDSFCKTQCRVSWYISLMLLCHFTFGLSSWTPWPVFHNWSCFTSQFLTYEFKYKKVWPLAKDVSVCHYLLGYNRWRSLNDLVHWMRWHNQSCQVLSFTG